MLVVYIAVVLIAIGITWIYNKQHILGEIDDDTNIQEGFQEGFNPLDIIKKIGRIFSTVGKLFSRFKYIGRGFADATKGLELVFKNGGLILKDIFVDSFNYVAAAASYAYRWFKCGIDKIQTIHYCFPFYILDIVLYFVYITAYSVCVLIDEVFRTRRVFGITLEKLLLRAFREIKVIDKYFYSISGVHLFSYPDLILNMCYKCKSPPDTKTLERRKKIIHNNFSNKFPKMGERISQKFSDSGKNFRKFFSKI